MAVIAVRERDGKWDVHIRCTVQNFALPLTSYLPQSTSLRFCFLICEMAKPITEPASQSIVRTKWVNTFTVILLVAGMTLKCYIQFLSFVSFTGFSIKYKSRKDHFSFCPFFTVMSPGPDMANDRSLIIKWINKCASLVKMRMAPVTN